MKLTFLLSHRSIDRTQDPIELPNLVVLTGRNGSGKTHLLEAIREGHIVVDEIEKSQVSFFDAKTFVIPNESQLSSIELDAGRRQRFKEFQANGLNGFLESQLGESGVSIAEIARSNNKSIFELNSDLVLDLAAKERLAKFKAILEKQIRNAKNNRSNSDSIALDILSKSNVLPSHISELTFNSYFNSDDIRDGILPSSLGKLFVDYHTNFERNCYLRFRNSEYGENNQCCSDEHFEKLYGGKPWDVLNDFLKNIVKLPFQISNPERILPSDMFSAELVQTGEPSLRIPFNDLSSGEKTLLALVAAIYTQRQRVSHSPFVVLLDEIDASLHPSMIKALFETLHRYFLSNDCRVILATHSPSTVALAPANSVFVMNAKAKPYITQKNQSEAVDLLSEGFMTLQESIQIFNEVALKKVNIISEGNNSNYIRKLLEIYQICDVHVIEAFKDRTGKNQLKTLYHFFEVAYPTQHVLFVWDHDAHAESESLDEYDKLHKFCFSKNEMSLAINGIENLFHAELFADYAMDITCADGNVRRKFDKSKKVAFEKFVLSRNCKSDFKQFEPLVEKIELLLKQGQ